MALGALSGFTIAVTADRRREEQSELIQRRGGEVLSGPVIRTLPLGDEAALSASTQAVIAQEPDVVVLCTALGVRGWMSGAEGLGLGEDLIATLTRAEVIARGTKAVGAATAVGVEVDWATPNATYSEILDHFAQRPVQRVDGTPVRVAVQLDGADSSDLVARIAQFGFDVLGVRVYEWHLPDDLSPAERLVHAAADGLVDAVTFTSAHSVANFQEIADGTGRWDEVVEAANNGPLVICCVGPITGAAARSVGFAEPVEPAHARLGAMVQALVRAFGERCLTLELDGQSVLLQGRLVAVGDSDPVRLTDRERAVLRMLSTRPGVVVSKQRLIDEVWCGEADEHLVEVTVGRLRKRLGVAGESIETVVRRGYRLTTA